MKHIRNILLASLVALPLLAQETWTVDKSHSTANFKIRHFTANVIGAFDDFDGTITMDRANPAKSSVEFTIQAASVDTKNEGRDKHLRSGDFFETDKFPTIAFKSTSVAANGKDAYAVTGDLTMHGVTKSVTLSVTFGGFLKTQRGEKAGFEIETTLNRKDYGITWNRALDEGGFMLSEDVKVTINLEMNKKMPEAAAAAPAAK
ncbi:MAG TPA: YceI family protein [Thermoanaerobaculia bacterium]